MSPGYEKLGNPDGNHGRELPLADPVKRDIIIKSIVEKIEHGMPVELARQAANLSMTTYQRWKANGKRIHAILEEKELLEPDDSFSPGERGLWMFWKSVRDAELACLDRNLLTLQVASQDHWQAAAWWCERRFPKEFGRTYKVEHSGNEENPVVTKDATPRRSREEAMRLLSPADRLKVIEARRILQSVASVGETLDSQVQEDSE